MALDVTTETIINRSPLEVAAYASDPANAPAWYENIRRVEWETDPPLRPGSRIAFVARFPPAGFAKAIAPFMGLAVRRANQKDLAALKALLEAAAKARSGP